MFTENIENRATLGGSHPILRVEDMKASLHFYLDLLGFKLVHWSTEEFSSIYRDRAAIYLCQRDQGAGAAWIWIGASDVDLLHAEIVAKGVTIRLPPTNFPGHWNCTSKIPMAT